MNWYISSGRYLYLFLNFGLLFAAMVAFIVVGTAKENAIIASQSHVGRKLFSFWMLQNAIIAIMAAASFGYILLQSPPELRKFLLPPILWF